MTQGPPLPLRVQAAATVDGVTGIPSYIRGCTVVNFPSFGTYDFTLGEPIANSQLLVRVQGINPPEPIRQFSIRSFSDTLKRVVLVRTQAPDEVVMPADMDTNNGNYMVRRVGGGGSHRFSFSVPLALPDFAQFFDRLEIRGIVSAGAANDPAAGIDLTSSFGPPVGSSTASGQSDIGSTFALPGAGDIFALPLSSVTVGILPGDMGGVLVDHQGFGGEIDYLGVFAQYSTGRGVDSDFTVEFIKLPLI